MITAYVTVMDTPVGRLRLEADERELCAVRLLEENETVDPCESPLLSEAERQIGAYFAGERRTFDLPLSMRGSAFDRAVWRLLMEIPFGETRSYGQLAAALGRPKASRAVGAACGRNPLLIIVPCHRVVGSTGKLTGFAAGLEAKRTLLLLEGFRIGQDRIYR